MARELLKTKNDPRQVVTDPTLGYFGPQNRFVLYADLGQDRIYVNKFDQASGQLTRAATPFVSLPAGDGPRHFAFHPNGRWFYSIQEEASTVAFFQYDAQTGALAHRQRCRLCQKDTRGRTFAPKS